MAATTKHPWFVRALYRRVAKRRAWLCSLVVLLSDISPPGRLHVHHRLSPLKDVTSTEQRQRRQNALLACLYLPRLLLPGAARIRGGGHNGDRRRTPYVG